MIQIQIQTLQSLTWPPGASQRTVVANDNKNIFCWIDEFRRTADDVRRLVNGRSTIVDVHAVVYDGRKARTASAQTKLLLQPTPPL